MSVAMTDGSLMLDKDAARAIRRLLAEVATLHPVPGDALGAEARRLQAVLPAPYVPPVRRVADEPLPRPAQPAEWWETKDKPEREQ